MSLETIDRCRPVIEAVVPQVDGGRFPIKRTVGERVVVDADCFVDGHDALGCAVRYRLDGDSQWREAPMTFLGNDRWRGEFRTEACGRYLYTVQAWVEHFASWRRDFIKRVEAEQDLSVALQMGGDLVEQAAGRAAGEEARSLADWAARLAG
ncbi:MAG: maltotransferase domain-containing protein, partial [Chromatiaceae bacterium]